MQNRTETTTASDAEHGDRATDSKGGWVRPAWATGSSVDAVAGNGNTPVHLMWNRDASIEFAAKDPANLDDGDGEPVAPSLNRSDDVSFDLDDGTMRTMVGAVIIYVHDNLEVSPPEARKLAAGLVELADIAEAGVGR